MKVKHTATQFGLPIGIYLRLHFEKRKRSRLEPDLSFQEQAIEKLECQETLLFHNQRVPIMVGYRQTLRTDQMNGSHAGAH